MNAEVWADYEARIASLSRREREVLVLSAKGLSHTEIGVLLNISGQTVNSYRDALRRKLDVSTTIEAAVIAAKVGLV